MFTTADRWITRQLGFASLIATLVLSGPVVLVSLTAHLPDRALYSNLLWPSLASIAPMILYHTLPALVAIAIIWCYGEFSANGTLVTLHLAGRSIRSIRLPAVIVALVAAILGYVTSMVIAPLTACHLHDVLYAVRHNTDPSLLRAGEFNALDRKGEVIYFKDRSGPNEFANVFVVKKEDDEERTYVARHALYMSDGIRNSVLLLDGSMQIFSAKLGKMRVVDFDRVSVPLTASAARGDPSLDELDTLQLLRSRADAFLDQIQERSWMREVASRFAIPGLVLIHILLGLELLAKLGLMTDRKRGPVAIICVGIAGLQLATVIIIEQVGVDVRWIWVAAALMSAELGVALALMINRSKNAAEGIRANANLVEQRMDDDPAVAARLGSRLSSAA